MIALPKHPAAARPTGVAALPPADRPCLDRIRSAAERSRSASHLDLYRACAMLSDGDALVTPGYAEALVRTLEQALQRRPRFYRPGNAEISFDEAWLMALLRALRTGDRDSATFLLHRRIRPAARRSVLFLAHGCLDRPDPVAPETDHPPAGAAPAQTKESRPR